MKISYNDWWNDVVAILRANASILLGVAGAFVFLPALIASFVAIPAVPPAEGATLDDVLAAYSNFFQDNWLPQTLLWLVTTLGQLLLFVVLLDERRPSVGAAFRIGLPLLIPFILVNLLAGLITVLGFFLLIIGAAYLFGRVLLAAPALVAERRGNPLTAIGRSWALTRGQGWRVFFFVLLILIVAFVIQAALLGTLGLLFAYLSDASNPYSVGKLLIAALEALLTSATFVITLTIYVALYRRLTVDIGKTFS